jgi:HSP20 family protein
MPARTEANIAHPGGFRDPFTMLRQMTTDFDRLWHTPTMAPFRALVPAEPVDWTPMVDVFEKDKRLVTRVDLPGMKKEDVKVEVTDGNLTISGERKREFEEKTDNLFRCEREYGSFFRSVPLPEGARVEDVQATFVDGVLEISIPLPVHQKAVPKAVEIH